MGAVGRRRRAFALWVVVVSGTACHASSAVITAGRGASTWSTSSTTEATNAARLSEADNGGSTTISVGQRLVVTLASTYWAIAPPSDPSVLVQDGPPAVTPGGPSCPSIPGTGCGTVVATFTALAPGQADLGADRTTCGEALRCSESQSRWRYHVHVAATTTTTEAVHPTTTTGVARTTVPATTSTVASLSSRSGVSGTVSFGPVCPVERIPPDPQCAPRPGAAEIQLVPSNSGAALKGAAGADGRFSIPAEPGTYVVKAVASTPSPGRGCSAEPAQVTVAAGSFASVSVTCDTGIR